MPYQVDDALLHAMSGTELSRVRTELRLLPEPNNQRLLMSRGADIVMQSSPSYYLMSGTRFTIQVNFPVFVLSDVVGARGKQLCCVGMINLFQSLTAKPESI